MSKESALKFLHTLGTNEKAKELLEQRKPANEEEKSGPMLKSRQSSAKR